MQFNQNVNLKVSNREAESRYSTPCQSSRIQIGAQVTELPWDTKAFPQVILKPS